MKNFLFIMLSISLLSVIAGCSGGLSAEFRDDYALFVETADRLDGLGVRDLSYTEYLIQWEEVQTQYNNLDGLKWPDQSSAAQASFESAMHSLSLVKQVWEVFNKGSGSWRCSLDRDVGNDIALTLEFSERLGATDESALKWLRSQTCDEIINDLMENFWLHYTVGKNEMEEFLW
ncbi:MAG: hypothetical protein K0B14_17220 [Anaerolineaceae bacterium]|nr:hypothetical protein [Anaerolineaceae bacterium]